MTSDKNDYNQNAAAIIEKCATWRRQIKEQIQKIVVGQDDVIEQLLITLLVRGHSLLEGVPGLAKTLMISSLAQAMHLKFSRIQFTPDLMPADITGIEVIEEDRNTGRRDYRFLEGPLFANIILADEINRTPPRTQAALLEAMQETFVTIGRKRYPLPTPFFVLATQNPLEQEGTYPLPEAQQDRFLFKIIVNYPSFEEEKSIALRATVPQNLKIEPIIQPEELCLMQQWTANLPVGEHIIDYAIRLVRQTRPESQNELSSEYKKFKNITFDNHPISELIRWGAGPRAVTSLLRAGQARAILLGRSHVTFDDINSLAKPVLRHRIGMSYLAQSEDITSDRLIDFLQDNMKQ